MTFKKCCWNFCRNFCATFTCLEEDEQTRWVFHDGHSEMWGVTSQRAHGFFLKMEQSKEGLFDLFIIAVRKHWVIFFIFFYFILFLQFWTFSIENSLRFYWRSFQPEALNSLKYLNPRLLIFPLFPAPAPFKWYSKCSFFIIINHRIL